MLRHVGCFHRIMFCTGNHREGIQAMDVSGQTRHALILLFLFIGGINRLKH